MTPPGWREALITGAARLAERLRQEAAAWDRDVARRALASFEAAHGLEPEPVVAHTLVERARPRGRPLVVHHGGSADVGDRARLAGWHAGHAGAVDTLAVLWGEGATIAAPGLDVVRADLTRAEAEARLGHPGDTLPETVLLDRDGGLLARHVGPLDDAALARFTSLVGASP